MPTPITARRSYVFGDFILDLDRGALLHRDQEVKLRPKSFAVLSHMVERPGRLVSKEELQNAIWGHTVVTEGTLTQCLIDIRRALGDRSQRIIRTVPRRGYLFELPVTVYDGASAPASARAADQPAAADSGRSRLRWGVLLAALVAIVGAAATWWGSGARMADREAPPTNPSIAVLPFVNLSPEPETTYLGDGVAEEILNALVGLEGLQVVGRTSSFVFRDRKEDLRDIGRQLTADYILEGSVRKDGQRVRISAQMIRTDNGYHVWSETFERGMESIFVLEDEVARGVAETLKLQLAGRRGERLVQPLTSNTEAYQELLRGRYHHARRTPHDFAVAKSHFARAAVLDPELAEARLGLAQVILGGFTLQRQENPFPLLDEARGHLETAIKLKANLGEAYAGFAFYYQLTMRWEESMAAYARGRELAPENGIVFLWSAAGHLTVGHMREAGRFVRRALELDPQARPVHDAYGSYLSYLGRTEEAIARNTHSVTLAPDYPSGWAALLIAHLAAGQYEAARRDAVSLELAGGPREREGLAWIELIERRAAGDAPSVKERLPAQSSFSETELINLLLLAGELDAAISHFEDAAERGFFSMTTIWLGSNPWLRAHFGHPRMAAALEKMGMIDFWRSTRPPDGCVFTASHILSCRPLARY